MPPPPDLITPAAARRIAIAAQGFNDPRPTGRATAAHFKRVYDRVGVLQIDSVNVLSRSHYLPVFSRLGHYDRAALDSLAHPKRHVFEYWAHMASFVPVSMYPLLWHRMQRYRELPVQDSDQISKILQRNPSALEDALQLIGESGPLRAVDLSPERANRRVGEMWGWHDGKVLIEHLFITGQVTAVRRNSSFERVYDLTERVIPAEFYNAAKPSADDARRELIRIGARSAGIATAKHLRDYFRIPVAGFNDRIAELVDSGELMVTTVRDSKDTWYVHRDAKRPRVSRARALLSPFDSLIWERDRTQSLFESYYRIEIYVPEPKRTYGYYVLPFLLDDQLVARVDLKAHRQAGLLVVKAAYAEAGERIERGRVVRELAAELASMAQWMGLSGVQVDSVGDLAADLRAVSS